MTQSHRLARDPALAAAVAFAFACVLAGWPSAGEAGKIKSNPPHAPQSAPAPASEASQEADQKKQAAAAARQAYDAGLKAFANGKYQPAIDQLSAAVKGGGLSNAEIAKALYTRGAAYKKQNKPGLAISDLTSALWLKNGLTGTDRQKATAERAEAYNMAGLQETGDASERAVVDNPNSSASSSSAGLSAAAVAQAAASQSQPASASGASGAAPAASGPVTRQDAESDAAKDAARARAAYGPVDAGGLQAAAAATVVRSPAESAAPAESAGSNTFAMAGPAEASPVAPVAPAPASSSTSSVSGFFSNLFGGGSPPPAPAAPESAAVTTASTAHAEPETSSWSSSTVVTEGKARPRPDMAKKAVKQHTQTAAIAPVAAPIRAAKAVGKYKVHIAALRSREEAEALAQKLVAQHGDDLGTHAPAVDEAVIGSMGTFYRVRIGGYASQDEPRGLCNKLRSSGLDCLVVTN